MTNDIHDWVERRLSIYSDNQLAPDERDQLDSHLQVCDRCKSSLDSLRWSVSLLKFAPIPAPTRRFTVPVTQPRPVRSSFGYLRVATALAAVLLCSLVGIDLLSQISAPYVAAPLPAAQVAAPAPTQNIALAPAFAPSVTVAPTFAAAAPRPTSAPPQAASQSGAVPTTTRTLGAGAAEGQSTPAQADQALKSSATIPAAPPAPRAPITNTLPVPSPSPTTALTAFVPGPTATTQTQARVEPVRGREVNAEPAPIPPTLRDLELGLLVVVIGLGALTILAWRRK